jgi:hypothetical protein
MSTAVIVYALVRGPGHFMYEAMAREKDDPRRTHCINEQTKILDSTQAAIREILRNTSKQSMPALGFTKRGNIFFAR